MTSGMIDERRNHATCDHDPIITMPQHNDTSDPSTGSHDDDDVGNGIDLTKSLYHLRLHGFDMVHHNTNDHASSSSSSSPTRMPCVTPAVSPVHSSSYRKRSSQLAAVHDLPQFVGRRPLSPITWKVTPTRTRRIPVLPFVNQTTSPPLLSVSQNTTTTTAESKSLHRVLPITITHDGDDEFEVMLESSISSDEQDGDGSEEYHFRNESSIMDSPSPLPQSCPSIDDHEADTMNTANSPQTPARASFCGMSSWCESSTPHTFISPHLFVDTDGSIPTTSFQLRYKSSSEWFVCPTTSASGCCGTTTAMAICNNDTTTDATAHSSSTTTSRQIAMVQSMLQHHICASLGDNMEALCWQKSASTTMPKSSASCHSGGSNTHQVTPSPLTAIHDEPLGSPTRHRRTSTRPIHRRVDEFTWLQYNLHPFDDDDNDHGTMAPIHHYHHPHCQYALHKSQSFPHPPASVAAPTTTTSTTSTGVSRKKYPNSDVGLVSTEWECGVLDFAFPVDHHDNDDEDVARHGPIPEDGTAGGYESDPEIFCRDKTATRRKNENPKPLPVHASHTLQEFLNERNTFIWHTSSSKSLAVHVWIELGQQLYDSLVLPKLCWKPILSAVPHGKIETTRSNIVGGTVSSMELLSICRIRQVTNTDREQFPFAQTQRLFSIQSAVDDNYETSVAIGDNGPPPPPPQTQQQTIILEARSIADRIRYTNLLKLTVASLAAKFITNDPDTLTMFFHHPTISDYAN